MDQLNDLITTVGGMPAAVLIFFVIAGAFALAAFAIHAVLTVAKRSDKT